MQDCLDVYDYLVKKYSDATFVFLGHSMGGSVAARACSKAMERDDKER